VQDAMNTKIVTGMMTPNNDNKELSRTLIHKPAGGLKKGELLFKSHLESADPMSTYSAKEKLNLPDI
jgi:hypothetical protein